MKQNSLFILLTLPVALLVGFLITQRALLVLGCLFVFLVMVVLIRKRHVAFALFYLSVFIPIGYVGRYFVSLPSYLLWLPYFCLLTGIVVVLVFDRKRWKTLPHYYLLAGFAWVVLTVLSFAANGSSAIPALLSLRWVFLFIGSVLLHRLYFPTGDSERIIRILVWIGIAAVPFTVIQRFYIISDMKLDRGDMVTGLFESYSSLVFFQLFCIMAVTSWWLHSRRLLPIHPAISIVLLFIPLVISNSKAAPIYFFLVMGFLLWQCRRKLTSQMLNVIFIVAILGTGGALVFDRIYQKTYDVSYSVIARWYNPNGALSYLLSDSWGSEIGGLQRGAAVVFNFELIKKDPIHFLFGLGPGALSDSRVPGGMGVIFKKYPSLLINSNSLSTTIGEMGLLGILLLAIFLIGFYLLRGRDESPENVILRKSTAFLLAALLIYTQVLLIPVIALVFGAMIIQNRQYSP